MSGGLHGVGATVTNALSEELIVEVKREGKVHRITYNKGVIVGEMEIVGTVPVEETGTMVKFKPDDSMFPEAFEEDGETDLSMEFIRERIKRTAYLTPKLRLIIISEDEQKKNFILKMVFPIMLKK